jgi:predicted DsbA family dithiol-disulfide isomerase
MNESQTRIAFSYWSDPLCIWAFVAQDKLDRILADFGGCLEVEYRIVPVFGSLPWRFTEGPWAETGVDGRVQATRDIARQHGCDGVTGECWKVDMPASSWPAGAAAKAVLQLQRQGRTSADAGARYLRRLREAFFVENRNVARRSVQLELAESLDVPRALLQEMLDDGSAWAALWEDHDARERLKIQGSPTYLFEGGRARLYGNFSYGILRATVEELVRGVGPGASAC